MAMSVLGTAASLAKKKAELAALNNVTLPRVYQSIGRKIAGVTKLPRALAEHVTRIRQLEAAIATDPVAPSGSDEVSFAAKAKQLAQKAAKATADAATSIQINSAYTQLGREAVRLYGDKAVPKEVAAELSALTAQQESLSAEISRLEESHSGGIVTPKRLVLAGLLIGLLFGSTFLIKGVGSIFGYGGRQTSSGRDTSSTRRQAQREGDLPPDLQAAAANAKEQKRQRAIDSMQRTLESILRTWRSKADNEIEPLSEDHRVASDRLDLSGSALVSFDAAAEQKLHALKESRSSSEAHLQKLLGEYLSRFQEMAQVAPNTRDLEPLQHELEEKYRAECDADVRRLRESRTLATAELNKLAREPEQKRKRLQESLAAELDAIVAEWAKGIRPLASLEGETQLPELSGLQDQQDWKKEYEDASRTLIAFIDGIIDDQRRQAISLAESLASAVGKDDSEVQARRTAQQQLKGMLATAETTAQSKRNDAVRRLTLWHASAMKQQSDREESAKQAKNSASQRKYEGEESLTDDELIEVIRLAPDITDLRLGKCRRLTDKCLPAIASLKNLKLLSLEHVDGMTPQGVLKLKDKELKTLTLPRDIRLTNIGFGVHVAATGRATGLGHSEDEGVSTLTDEGVEAMRGAPYVFTLTLPTRVTDRGLAALQDIPRLTELSVPLSPGVTDKGVSSLANCKHLRLLKFTWPQGAERTTSVTPRGIEALKSLRLLELDLPSEMHTEEFFAPALQSLSDTDADRAETDLPAGVAGGDWPLLRTWTTNKRLIRLTGRQSDISGRGFGDFGEWPCTPRTLSALVGQRGIKELLVRNAKAEHEMLACLGKIPDLEKLTLTEVEATGSGLETLREAKNLRFLGIINCPTFDVAGIEAIAQCDQLNTVNCSGVPKLGDAELLLLTANKGLRQLFVARSRASGSLVVKLQNAMPDCHVEVND